MKKIISMVLGLMLFFSMTVTAMAGSFQVTTDKDKVCAGDNVTVTIKLDKGLEGNYRNIQGQLNYDPDLLSYVSHEMSKDPVSYTAKNMTEREYFTFSYTDFSRTGFAGIPKGTIGKVVFKAAKDVTFDQVKTALTLTMSVQDLQGNIEKTEAETELVICKNHTPGAAATCTKPQTCTVCGITLNGVLKHSFDQKNTDGKYLASKATCTAAAKYYKSCSCGEKGTDTFTSGDVLGHKYSSSYTVDKQATTSADGSKSKHCTRSGCTAKSSVTAIPKISSAKLSYTKTNYSGSVKKPTVTVKDSKGNTLVNGTDYSVSYASGRTQVGRYKVTITYKGKYSGSKALYFTIVPKAPSSATAMLTPYYGQTAGYDDVKFSWSKVTGASGYNVYYKKSTSSSYTYLTRTTGTSIRKKDLADGVKYYFKVVPYYKSGDTRYTSLSYKTASVYTLKQISTPTVTKSGTKVKVSWKNINGETGYQISRSTSKTGTNIVYTYATTSGTYKTVSATKGKTYYYRVRAYKTVDGKKIYGPWSEVVKYKR